MRKHTKLYMEHFGYDTGDFIPSELTGQRCVDINHINARGMGGTKKKDHIDNLIGMTREEHLYFGDKKYLKDWLRKVHQSFIETQVPWINVNPHCDILKTYLTR